MIKKLCCLLVLLGTATVLCGCGSLWQAPTPTPQPITLRFVFSQRAKEEKYQDAAKAFKLKYPNITVEVERTNNVPRRVDAGGVDVFEAEQFDFPGLLQKNAIRDLTPILDSALDFPSKDFFPRVLEVFRSEGRQWAIPSNVDPFVIFYNKDLCDQMQVPYPQPGWDWDDFLMTAKALSKPEQTNPQYGFIPDPYGLGVWAFVYQHGGQVVDNLVQPTRATLDDPLVVEAVQWYVDLARVHQVMPALTSTSPEWQRVMTSVWVGRAGMWLLPLSERGGVAQRRAWIFKWGVVPLPRDAKRITFITVSGYFISARTSHVRESWRWIEYLTKEADLPWDVPPRSSLVQSEKYRIRVGDEVYAVAQEVAQYGLTLPSAVWLSQIPADSLTFLDDIITGKKTTAEALQATQKVWDKAISSMSK